jgi:uncharacterized membrane protein
MFWILLALLAHTGSAVVFVVDKSLLGSKSEVSNPLKYAFYSALLAGVAIVILPFSYAPLTSFVLSWSALAGFFHIVALWLFFRALKSGESSRVVPVAGSTVPLFTFIFALMFLGETLSGRHVLAVLLLIIGGALLSVKIIGGRGLSSKVILGAIISGVFFAGYFATMKFVYSNTDSFLATFVYSRVAEALLALVVLYPFVLAGKKKDMQVASAGKKKSLVIGSVFISNKILAAGSFLLLNYAINLGSVSVVNALQGTQYLLLLLLAVMVSAWWPKLFKEEISRVVMGQKVLGIIFLGAGLAFLI